MAEDLKSVSDKAAQMLREKGALLTMDIARSLNLSSLIAGAVLSELVAKKIAEVSSLKVGSSPVYYIPERKHLLEQFAKHLGSKEKEVYEMLKSKKVVRDSDLEPAERVALSRVKDFAVAIEAISKDGSSEKFWKLYSVSNEQVKEILLEKQKKGTIERDAKLTDITRIKRDQAEELPQKELSKDKQEELGKHKQEEKPEREQNEKNQEAIPKPPEPEHNKADSDRENKDSDKDITENKAIMPELDKNSFTEKVFNYFGRNDVSVLSFNIVKKDKEFNCIASFQTPFGKAKYYVFCKNKSRINEQDISDAYIDAMNKHLPLIFITSGRLTKKCVESLSSKFKSVLVKII
ncbi:MAG TPA: hypothetical protein ENN46_04230 [Candidatus Woesearchaeota archaeon]|nr:hypothetical protein [Candidatus Woesearchaeota archaeon]